VTAALDRKGRTTLTRAMLLARLVLVFERLLPVVAPFAVAGLALTAAALWGLFETAERTFVLACLTVAGVSALAVAARNAVGFRWPTRDEARRRVEADSGLTHAPFSALVDSPAAGDEGLWALHQARSAEAARRARVGGPRAAFAAADPYAFRYAFGLVIGLGVWAQGSAGIDRARAIADLGPAAAAPALIAQSYRRPEARLLAEAARSIRAERRPYADGAAAATIPSWYGPFGGLDRAPHGVKDAADMLAGFDSAGLDPAARIGLGWAQRRLAAAETLDEARAVAAEFDRMALRLERGGAPAVRSAGAIAGDGRV
jgi:hypothetical protein